MILATVFFGCSISFATASMSSALVMIGYLGRARVTCKPNARSTRAGPRCFELAPHQAPSHALITDHHMAHLEAVHHALEDHRAGEDHVGARLQHAGNLLALSERGLAKALHD